MSSKHTPGPWKICYDNDTGPNDGCFRQWWQVGPAQVNIGSDHEEAEANARLIAAAPELLDACRALLCMLDRGCEPRKIDEALTWRENDEKARKMAVDAIRKATGESLTSPR